MVMMTDTELHQVKLMFSHTSSHNSERTKKTDISKRFPEKLYLFIYLFIFNEEHDFVMFSTKSES